MPAARPVAVDVVCAGVVFQEYVYGAVPPLGVPAVAVPVAVPKHFAGVALAVTARTTGCVTVAVAVALQPLASVTVTV